MHTKKKVKTKLNDELEKSKKQIVAYYLQKIIKNPPDALIGETLGEVSIESAEKWIMSQLDKNGFPEPGYYRKNVFDHNI